MNKPKYYEPRIQVNDIYDLVLEIKLLKAGVYIAMSLIGTLFYLVLSK